MEFIIEDMARLQKNETFGGRLTEAREEAERGDGGYGYTQAELVALLAERCEVEIGRSYLSELERRWQQNKMPSLEVAAAGPAMLTTEDTAAANAWFRRYVRVFVRDNQVSEVRFNFW